MLPRKLVGSIRNRCERERRRRWWKLLRTLDTTIELSEPMRVELLLELSGLTRQEALVIKACAEDPKNFDAVSRVLVDHYSGVHLRGQNPERKQHSSSLKLPLHREG